MHLPRSRDSSKGNSSTATRSAQNIIPRGFEVTAHPIFKNFQFPSYRPTPSKAASISNDNVTVDHTSQCSVTSTVGNQIDQLSAPSKLEHCPICLLTITRPVTIVSPCAHSYCFLCLHEWFKQRTVCPLCNTPAISFVTFREDEQDMHVTHSIPKKSLPSIIHDTKELQVWYFINSEDRSESGHNHHRNYITDQYIVVPCHIDKDDNDSALKKAMLAHQRHFGNLDIEK